MDIISQLTKIMVLVSYVTSLGLSVESTNLDGYPEKIYTIEASMNSMVTMVQKLSNDQVYGYGYLSEMAQKEDGTSYILGTNGMFYDAYGQPEGILIIDGEVVRSTNADTPLFIIRQDGSVELREVKLQAYLETNEEKIPVYEFNDETTEQNVDIISRWYLKYSRMEENKVRVLVKNGEVVRLLSDSESYDTSDLNVANNDFIAMYESIGPQETIKQNDDMRISLESDFDIDSVDEAFQTGGWLVKDGVNVAGVYQNVMGETRSLQPRTAIGITSTGKIILKVVDGRQSGVSSGVSGQELAQLMIEDGCIDAAYLDGGSSSAMVQNGQIISSPSMGEEKVISHGLFLDRKLSGEILDELQN